MTPQRSNKNPHSLTKGGLTPPFFDMKNTYTICIEAFIRWEQLSGRSFQQMDFANVGDLHRLLYCAYIIDDPTPSTYEVFERALTSNQRLYKSAIGQLSRYSAVSAQFATIERSPSITDDATPDEPLMIGDVAARLVISGGLDAHYVMREMTMEDMLRYVRALDDKQRQEAEAQRLWAYLSILPHVDSRKLNSPAKLIAFPWEVAASKAEAIRIAEQSREEFEQFMRGELYPAPKKVR